MFIWFYFLFLLYYASEKLGVFSKLIQGFFSVSVIVAWSWKLPSAHQAPERGFLLLHVCEQTRREGWSYVWASLVEFFGLCHDISCMGDCFVCTEFDFCWFLTHECRRVFVMTSVGLGMAKTDIVILLDTMNVLNVKLCMITILTELYLYVPLLVTFTTFQGHNSIRHFQNICLDCLHLLTVA